MRGSILTCVALGAALAAGPAASEVRLADVSGTLMVEVSSTPRGPWTPTGDVTTRILNPSGDLFGDGMPGWDTRGDAVLSAWIRPGSGLLHQSIGRGSTWNALTTIESSGAQGQPVVDVVTGGWSVVWQKGTGAAAQVLVGAASPEGAVATPILASAGVLVGTSPAGNLLHVITMEGYTGQLWCTTVAFAFVPTQPIPIQLVIVSRVPLRRIELVPTNQPGSNGHGRGGRDAEIELQDPRVRDVVLKDGSPATVVTWKEGSVLRGVKLTDEGPQLPGNGVSTRNGRDHLTELLDGLP